MTENENLDIFRKSLEIGSNKNRYLVFDADNTLIDYDSTTVLLKYLNGNFKSIKDIFKEHGYIYKSFYEVAKYYSEFDIEKYKKACELAAKEIEINNSFLMLILSKMKDYEIVILTAGSRILWEHILKKYNLENIKVIGGHNLKTDSYLVTDTIKGTYIRFLKENKKDVYSFGDSLIDKYMLLYSDISFVVIYKKLRKELMEFLKGKDNSYHLIMKNYQKYDVENIGFHQLDELLMKENI